MWHGRLVKEKGVLDIIKVARIVTRYYPAARFVLVGEGPLKKKLIKLIHIYSLRKNVFLLGRVPYDKIPLLLPKASIYIFPSYMEGMPYALLEAMACGLPIIAYDIPQIRETTRGECILVKKGDVKALAEAILLLLKNEELRKK